MIPIMVSIIKAIVAWFVLMLIGTNLMGLFVRGLFIKTPTIRGLHAGFSRYISKQISKYKRSNFVVTLFFAVVCVIYIFILFEVWNIGVAVAATLLMIARIPTLLFEIRTGERINRMLMPRDPLGILTTVIAWATLPLLWFSLR